MRQSAKRQTEESWKLILLLFFFECDTSYLLHNSTISQQLSSLWNLQRKKKEDNKQVNNFQK